MKLFLNHVSSATARVRIALALKRVEVETQSIGIFGHDAESRQETYRKVNPQGLVPALLTDNGSLITQSIAIIEYLDEIYPEPPLLPSSFVARALARSVALAIASEVHALLPPRVALKLQQTFGADATVSWNHYWVTEGFDAVEKLFTRNRRGALAITNQPTIADIVLYPQVVSAKHMNIDFSRWPNIADVFSRLERLPAFAENAPSPRT